MNEDYEEIEETYEADKEIDTMHNVVLALITSTSFLYDILSVEHDEPARHCQAPVEFHLG